MKLRALIVDDELHARENLKYLIRDHCPELEVVGVAGDPTSAREEVKKCAPHVLFLDICMPSGTEGFEFLESLPDKNFQVVFVTAFKEYAIRALNANAIHYLQKPVDVDELRKAVNNVVATYNLFCENAAQQLTYMRSLDNLTKTQSMPIRRITIHHAAGYDIVEQKDFMYLCGEGDNTAIVFSDGSRRTDSKSISVYEHMLEPQVFYRIHKSHIVNLNCVKELQKKNGLFVVMKNDERLPISRMRLRQFLQLFDGGKGHKLS